jgi:SAM-dependent methyltransferase
VGSDADYYRDDLALVHHLGFAAFAEQAAPAIVELLRPVRERGGLVVELGCGSGILTRALVEAGHRVIATDASPAMLELARRHVPGAEDVRRLVLPDDPIPGADAIVSVGHVLSYLPDAAAIDRALVAAARALRPGGVLSIDLLDLDYGPSRRDAPPFAKVTDDWAIVTRYSLPAPDRFVREITTFLPRDDDAGVGVGVGAGAGGTWRRDDERHENVLVDTARVPALLADHGVTATVGASTVPGMRLIVGHRAADAGTG